jgi:hypothetical protein
MQKGDVMNNKIRTTLLAAAVITALAAPALADTAVCTVSAPEIRLRKSPSKKAHIVAVLKKDARVTASGPCAGGWVKVSSEDGRHSGYVGGWALAAAAPTVAAAPVTPATPAVAKAEAAPPVAALKEIPSNEKLAVQITELRLNVLGIERDMEKMHKEIQKIKVSIGHKKGVRHAGKGHKQLAKKE